MAQVGGQHAQGEAQQGVACEVEELLPAQQGVVLVDEGREGGESAAEAHREEEPQLGVEQIAPFEETVEQPDGQAAGDVDRQRPPWEARGGVALDEPRKKVACNTAGKTSGTDEKRVFTIA